MIAKDSFFFGKYSSGIAARLGRTLSTGIGLLVTTALLSLASTGVFLPVSAYSDSSIWSDSTVPAIVDSGDGNGVEVGVKFRSDAAGYVTGLRFYKSAANTGTHVGHLWTST